MPGNVKILHEFYKKRWADFTTPVTMSWKRRSDQKESYATEGISVLFSFIGGLGMFLYGMHVMANGLQHFAGGKMQRLMSFLTQNRLMAILVVTSSRPVIQSSSATTVMVVGFVNAGMLNLSQAVGVIMVRISEQRLPHGWYH